jgi:hypothetical protein
LPYGDLQRATALAGSIAQRQLFCAIEVACSRGASATASLVSGSAALAACGKGCGWSWLGQYNYSKDQGKENEHPEQGTNIVRHFFLLHLYCDELLKLATEK